MIAPESGVAFLFPLTEAQLGNERHASCSVPPPWMLSLGRALSRAPATAPLMTLLQRPLKFDRKAVSCKLGARHVILRFRGPTEQNVCPHPQC